MDCTPWVLGGLWPAELHPVTSETALIAKYLKNDLQRIADSANERLRTIAAAGLDEQVKNAEESRVINVARAFAVLRVESTVRQLRKEPLGFQPELRSPPRPLGGRADVGAVAEPQPEPEVVAPVVISSAPGTPLHEPLPAQQEPPVPAGREVIDVPAVSDLTPTRPLESELQCLVRFVARQASGLRWAAGRRADGSVVLTTDLAHGWIPPGVDLPDGVELPAPKRRSGTAVAMLGDTEATAAYVPGDSFGGFADREKTATSTAPRHLVEVADLEQRLAETTRGRAGLPRLTHALAAAVSAGDPVVEAQADVLRVHLDTARYQLLAHYPDLDNPLLLNCLLLAATEALVTGDLSSANYHFAWFTALSGPPAGRWDADRGPDRGRPAMN